MYIQISKCTGYVHFHVEKNRSKQKEGMILTENMLNWFMRGWGNREKRGNTYWLQNHIWSMVQSHRKPITSTSLGCSLFLVLFDHLSHPLKDIWSPWAILLGSFSSPCHDSHVMEYVNALEPLLWNSNCKVSKWKQNEKCFLQRKDIGC